MMDIIEEKEFSPDYGILHHQEGMDLIPANMELSGIEVSLANTMSREMILKEYIEMIRDRYDYILIDTMPSLGVMTISRYNLRRYYPVQINGIHFKYAGCIFQNRSGFDILINNH